MTPDELQTKADEHAEWMIRNAVAAGAVDLGRRMAGEYVQWLLAEVFKQGFKHGVLDERREASDEVDRPDADAGQDYFGISLVDGPRGLTICLMDYPDDCTDIGIDPVLTTVRCHDTRTAKRSVARYLKRLRDDLNKMELEDADE